MSPRRVHEIKDEIRKTIAEGPYLPGALLPSQRQMAEQYGTSNTTVNKALHELAAEGVIEVRERVGSVVARTSMNV